MQTLLNDEKEKVCIGIPCFQGVTYEVLSDYMRLAYHLGRRNQEYDFFLAVKGKSEQFRARNAIVQQAIAANCDFLFMLDDDHVIDLNKTLGPNECYDIIVKLISRLKEDPKRGIVGALYYQRGASCDPVIMFQHPPGYSFYGHAEVSRRLQMVDVTGGGAMCINMKVFDKIDSPWFQPELGQGTDIQICEKVRDAGWEVWCDTSIEIGHIMTEREVVSSKNVHNIRTEASQWMNREDIQKAPQLACNKYIELYAKDIKEYTGKTSLQLEKLREEYNIINFPQFNADDLETYYRNLGVRQIARNYWFHSLDVMVQQGLFFLSLFNPNVVAKGLDFGCGTAPIGFELALRGHAVDFVDVPKSAVEDLVKWRVQKHKVKNCGFALGDEYDWVLFLDSIEHLHPDEMEQTLLDIIARIKPGGSIVTNYWMNTDHNNVEHINMRHDKVEKVFLNARLTMLPIIKGAQLVERVRWIKGDQKNEWNIKENNVDEPQQGWGSGGRLV